MKKVLITRPGSFNVLKIVESPDPLPGAGEYRVKVHAVGVNFADIIIRQGYYQAAKGKYPITPGFEFSGVIDAMGEGVTGFNIGERVFGFTLFGGYSSMQIVRPTSIHRVPANWSFEQAASLPTSHLTAYHSLHNAARVKAGEVLLIHSAAGGVGLALLQQAHIAGCQTIGVVGMASKVEVARQSGANHVLLKDKLLWHKIDQLAPSGIDAAFDANGITTLKPAFKRLRPGGRLVVYGFAEMLRRGKKPFLPWLILNWLRVPRFSPFGMTSTNRSLIGLNLAFMAERIDLASVAMADIARWAGTGQITPVPVHVLPLERVAEAHKLLESGVTVGKIILTCATE